MLVRSKDLIGNRCLVKQKLPKCAQTLKELVRKIHNMGSIACHPYRMETGSWHVLILSQIFYISWLSSYWASSSTTEYHNENPWCKTTNKQPDSFNRHPSPPSLLPLDQRRRARIVDDGILCILWQGGLPAGWKGWRQWWDTKMMEAIYRQRRRNHLDKTLFPTGFWWALKTHDSGYGREQIEKDQNYTTSLRPLSSYAENYWKSKPDNPDSTELDAITHIHWKTRTYLEGHCGHTDEAKLEEIWWPTHRSPHRGGGGAKN